jgi:hypothetical protein
MGIDNLTAEEAAKLREAMTVRANYVACETGLECSVSIHEHTVILKLGAISIHLQNFAAEALGRELMSAGVHVQYTMEAKGLDSETTDAA